MANTLVATVLRQKYRKATLEVALRNKVIAEKICEVNREDTYTIPAPYLTAPSVTVQALAGTYTPNAVTTNTDTLTVADEVVVSTHIFGFETIISKFDLFMSFAEDQAAQFAIAVDKWVLNVILEDGTGTYTTPTGGFTTASNVLTILANLQSKVAGYSDAFRGTYLVIENTDLPGIIQAGATNGFNFADAVLNNGLVGNLMGTDIYVVRTGTFDDETTSTTSGTKTWTNDGHRLFGVKGVTTYAAPRGVQYEEKDVTGKTGKEIVTWGLIGAKVWTPKAALTVDITLA